ncbi:MAG: hypothetical protein V8T45_05265 [Oscillospiraceae bacterium]
MRWVGSGGASRREELLFFFLRFKDSQNMPDASGCYHGHSETESPANRAATGADEILKIKNVPEQSFLAFGTLRCY